MSGSASFLNWHEQREVVENFLSSTLKVMHVRGGSECAPDQFSRLLNAIVSAQPRPMAMCTVDPLNQATSTPIGALSQIYSGLALELPPLLSHGAVTVASNIRARSVTIENVAVEIVGGNEGERLGAMVDHLLERLDRIKNVDRLLIHFEQCDEMDVSMRRYFWSSLWVPVVAALLERGARAVFQYAPHALEPADKALPAVADIEIDLPPRLGRDVLPELAALAAKRGWEAGAEGSAALARTVHRTSPDVRAIYAQLARLEMVGTNG